MFEDISQLLEDQKSSINKHDVPTASVSFPIVWIQFMEKLCFLLDQKVKSKGVLKLDWLATLVTSYKSFDPKWQIVKLVRL